MATALTAIFGNEIKVFCQPRQAARQYVGFPGVHGVVATHLGTRGRQLVINGRLRAATRPLLATAIAAIESYLWADAADYTFAGETYSHVVFDRFRLVPDNTGKAFHFTSEDWVTCDFVCYARLLI